MNGFTGKLLRVNLSNKEVSVETLNMEWARQYLGCGGLGARYLYDELAPDIEPLGSENKIILATGPLVGTNAPCCSKYTIVTKSPLSNGFIDSTAGGRFGPEVKYAGYDVIIIEGKAEQPVYILIKDASVEIRDAVRFWGKGTHYTEDTLKQWCGEVSEVLSIGPAGEKLSKLACVITGYFRAHGRGGIGAVFGSKNLKAIVVKGSGGVGVAEPEAFLEASKKAIFEGVVENERMKCYTGWKGGRGTWELLPIINEIGSLTTRNYSTGAFEGVEKIGLEASSKFVSRFRACYQCPMACSCYLEMQDSPYGNISSESPEFETIALLGSNCSVDNLASLVKLNVVCADLGLDTMTTGSVAAWAMECYEKGLITQKDTDGLELHFGNHEALVKLLEKIATREGIGDLLADGPADASKKIGKGSEDFAMHVKGMGIPAYDPRTALGMGLGYATAPPGAHHTRAFTLFAEVFGGVWLGADPVELDRFSPKGKALLVIQQQHWQIYRFNAGDCDFAMGTAEAEFVQNLVKTATGWKDSTDWRTIGERYINLTRMFNLREGLTKKDDTLPKRFFKDKVLSGPTKDKVISPGDFEFMLNEYYELRGWDKEGRPTPEKLSELGINDLLSRGKAWV